VKIHMEKKIGGNKKGYIRKVERLFFKKEDTTIMKAKWGRRRGANKEREVPEPRGFHSRVPV